MASQDWEVSNVILAVWCNCLLILKLLSIFNFHLWATLVYVFNKASSSYHCLLSVKQSSLSREKLCLTSSSRGNRKVTLLTLYWNNQTLLSNEKGYSGNKGDRVSALTQTQLLCPFSSSLWQATVSHYQSMTCWQTRESSAKFVSLGFGQQWISWKK